MPYTIQNNTILGSSGQGIASTALPNTSALTNVNNSTYQGAFGASGVPFAPINASSLNTNPNNVVPPPVNNNSAQMNLGTQNTAFTEGIAGNQALTTQANNAASVVTPTNSRQSILDKISGLLGVQSTQGQVSSDIFNQEGVQAKKELTMKLENEALAKDRAYQKQAEKIRANAEGKFGGAVEQDLANLERQRNSELADIAIQSKIATGNYQSAFEIADAKIKAQFEPIENQIKTLQNLYQLYGNDLTDSEKMQAQAKIQEKQSALDFARQKELVKYKSDIELAQKMAEGKAAGLTGTASQFQAAGYANRIEQANIAFKQLSPTINKLSYAKFKASLLAPSALQSPEMQQFAQATQNFVNAQLRRESGAAISPTEIDNAIKQYIPSPGDSAATLKLKEQNRLLNQRNLINEASTAYQPLSADLTPNTTTETENPFSAFYKKVTGTDAPDTSSFFNPQADLNSMFTLPPVKK